MALVNRDKDTTEQRFSLNWADQDVIGISLLIPLGQVPCAAQFVKTVSYASGLSGSPILGLQLQRFIPGTGFTTFALNGSSLTTVAAYSTSGYQTLAVPPQGSTLGNLVAGDQLFVVTSGANTAATYNISAVLQVLQDVKSDYGS